MRYPRFKKRPRPARSNFLDEIWAVHPTGTYVFLAAKSKSARWIEQALLVDHDLLDRIREFLRRHPAKTHDLYFCPNCFSKPKRKAIFALRTSYAWVDIDEADPATFDPEPSITWATSPYRYQALWFLSRRVSVSEAERISKFLAYQYFADRNGWSITKYLRVPGTTNHKPIYKKPKVKVIWQTSKQADVTDLLQRAPKVPKLAYSEPPDWIDSAIKLDFHKIWMKHRKRPMHQMTRSLAHASDTLVSDRSKAVFHIMMGLAEAGVPWRHIACILWNNPHFIQKHGPDAQVLAGEIHRGMAKFEAIQEEKKREKKNKKKR